MKKFIQDFLRRGTLACGIGPIVLAIVYVILHQIGKIEMLSTSQVCIGIFSLSALAFIAGGMNAIYQIDSLPLMSAILIQGIALYFGYLVTYLVNDWLDVGVVPIIVFTVIFVVGYLLIWGIIYFFIKRKTEKLNQILIKKQKTSTK